MIDTTDPRLSVILRERDQLGRAAGRLRCIRKDGSTFEGEASSAVFLDRTGEPRTSMIIRDISAVRQMEATLQASRDFLQSALDALSANIAILDAEGAILAVNAAWSRFATENGLEADAAGVGANYLAVCDAATGLWSDEASGVAQAIRDLAAGRQDTFEIEYPCHSPERQRWFAMRATRFLAGNGGRVVVAHEDITARWKAEEARRGFPARLLQVQEEERRHLARELHDEIGQILTGLKLSLETAAGLSGDRRVRLEEDAARLAGDLLARVREMSLDLRPLLLDDLGLLPTLQWHVRRFGERTRLSITLEQSGLEGRRFPAEVEVAVYRIVQEALTNAARHAAAPVTVRLVAEADTLSLRIEDRGPGFDAGTIRDGARHGGLSGMEERVRLLGGRLAIDSTLGAGTCIRVEIPLPEAAGDDREGAA